MYLSAERIAIANRAVQETFEQCSIVWQAIPQWDTGDPGQTRVRNDSVTVPAFIGITSVPEDFEVTLAEAIAPTPDALLAKVMAHTVKLAAKVDDAVIPALRTGAGTDQVLDESSADTILDGLIDARAIVEKAGYRAASCLMTDTAGIKKLSQLISGYNATDVLLGPANINSLHRVEVLEEPAPPPPKKARGILLGRRQRISHGGAPGASPGEEPVDLAVSVAPGLEVVGDTPDNKIALTVRVSYAVRIKDEDGVVALIEP